MLSSALDHCTRPQRFLALKFSQPRNLKNTWLFVPKREKKVGWLDQIWEKNSLPRNFYEEKLCQSWSQRFFILTSKMIWWFENNDESLQGKENLELAKHCFKKGWPQSTIDSILTFHQAAPGSILCVPDIIWCCQDLLMALLRTVDRSLIMAIEPI